MTATINIGSGEWGERPLQVLQLEAWYGESYALEGVSLEVNEGELVSIIGRNGAGKSTTLKSIMGVISKVRGQVKINGVDVIGKKSNEIARMGVGWCPEERGIFASLSVEENLLLPPVIGSGGISIEEIYRLFPNLEERRKSQGTHLSGGEQQMLAMARILRTGARILLLDEITEGLAPVIIDQLGATVSRLKHHGYTIVLVEQNFHFVSVLADRNYVMEHGKIIDEISAAQSAREIDKLTCYLGM